MAARLPKTGNMKRIHTHMDPAWARIITRAADLKGVTRSYYIATVAHAQATKDVDRAKAAK